MPTKPTTPLFGWATSTSNREAPTAGEQVTGFRAGSALPGRVLNALLGNARDWLAYIIGAFQLTEDAGALETWIPDATKSVPTSTSPDSLNVLVQDVGPAYIAGVLVEPTDSGNVEVPIPIGTSIDGRQWHAVVMDAAGDLDVISMVQFTAGDDEIYPSDAAVDPALYFTIAWVRTATAQTSIPDASIVDKRQTRPLTGRSIEQGSVGQDRLAKPPVYIDITAPGDATSVNSATEWEWDIPFEYLYLDGSGSPDFRLDEVITEDAADYHIRVELFALVTPSPGTTGAEVRCGADQGTGQKLYVYGDPPTGVPDWPTSPGGGNPAVVEPQFTVVNPGDDPEDWRAEPYITIRAPSGEALDSAYVLKITPIGPGARGVPSFHYLTLTTP